MAEVETNNRNHQGKRFLDLDFNTVWNSLLLVTVIGLLITTREDIATLGSILHEKTGTIQEMKVTLDVHSNDLMELKLDTHELKVRVGAIEKNLGIKEDD